MTVSLRPYQVRPVDDLRAAYRRGRRAPLLVAPTAFGKTVVSAHIIQSAVAMGNRALFVAPRRELIGQTVRKLADAGVHDVRVIQAKNDTGRADASVIVGSIQTLVLPRWLGRLPHADLVIADEAHHMAAAEWSKLAGAYPNARWLGLSATPERADGKPLGDIFDELVVAASVAELMDLHDADPTQGLVRCRVFCPTPQQELDAGQLALDPVTAYQQHGAGELAVVFCVSIDHASRTVADFISAGIPAAVVSGSTPARRRAETLRRWADGEIRVVANCGVLTEGFDLPALSVCIFARRFGHAGLYLQCIGRVLRPWPGKTHATAIDLCGSAIKHGPPDMQREYSLEGKAISAVKRDAIRQCARCGAVFLTAQACPTCGGDVPRMPVELPRSTNVGVVELTARAARPPVPVRTPPIISIVAKRRDRCRKCAGGIRPGDRIWWSKGQQPWHANCDSGEAVTI